MDGAQGRGSPPRTEQDYEWQLRKHLPPFFADYSVAEIDLELVDRAKGRFAVTTRIPAIRKPGRYTITGRCGRSNLGAVARLRVIKP